MNKELIREYIFLGITNWFKEISENFEFGNYTCDDIYLQIKEVWDNKNIYSLIELITSRSFLESIEKWTTLKFDNIQIKQAKAITNEKLEEYIKFIFKNKKQKE